MRKSLRVTLFVIIGFMLVLSAFNVYIVQYQKASLAAFGETVSEMTNALYNADIQLTGIEHILYRVSNKTLATQPDGSSVSTESLEATYVNNRYRLQQDYKIVSEKLLAMEINKPVTTKLIPSTRVFIRNQRTQISEMKAEVDSIVKLMDEELPITLVEQPNVITENITSMHRELAQLNNAFSTAYLKYANRSGDIYVNMVTALMLVLMLATLCLVLIVDLTWGRSVEYLVNGISNLTNKNYTINPLPKLPKRYFKEVEIFQDKMYAFLARQKYSHELKHLSDNSGSLEEMMSGCFNLLNERVRFERMSVAFVDYVNDEIVMEYVKAMYENVQIDTGFKAKIEATSLSHILSDKKHRVNQDLGLITGIGDNNGLELILKESIKSNLIVPLLRGRTVFGFVFFSSVIVNQFKKDEVELLCQATKDISRSLEQYFISKVAFSQIMNSFAELFEKRNDAADNTLTKVSTYSRIIANAICDKKLEAYPLTRAQALEISRYASIHDIGAAALQEGIIEKPGKLSDFEWELLKHHSEMGAEALKQIRKGLEAFPNHIFDIAEQIIRYHHENFDGTGYPEGLKGNEIPLSAHIVSLADVFDALTSRRPYRKALAFKDSVDTIKSLSGSKFDPVLVQVFLENIDQIEAVFYESLDESI